MKKYLVNILMIGAFLLMLAGAAYAEPKHYPFGGTWGNGPGDCRHNVPEPASIALLSSGMAGIGLFNLIKRKNRK
jgi:hypothetical protein